MAWQKVPESLVQAFDRALPEDPRLERRKMFGCPSAFVGGQMFAGLFEDYLFVRLPDETRTDLLGRGWRAFEPMPGRPMREYVVAPPAVVDDEAALQDWLERGLAYAAALPPKEKKPKRAKR